MGGERVLDCQDYFLKNKTEKMGLTQKRQDAKRKIVLLSLLHTVFYLRKSAQNR